MDKDQKKQTICVFIVIIYKIAEDESKCQKIQKFEFIDKDADKDEDKSE